MIDTEGYNPRSLRPENMTQENYSFYLGGISKRTIENWEYRGTPQTTWHLLIKIKELQEKIEQLEKKLKDKNMTFQL